MLTVLLSLGALVLATTETTANCPQGDESFLRGLLELGFKEESGTVDKFLAKETNHLRLTISEEDRSLVLKFNQLDGTYSCDINFHYSPGAHKDADLGGIDDGPKGEGHHDCETAVVASMAVIEDMLTGANKGLALLKH